MKRIYTILSLSSILFFLLLSINSYGQYLETFSIPNRGVLAGTCAGTEASCTVNYTGVDWVINGDFSGMDGGDFFSTDGSGRLNADGDSDAMSAPGTCFETPLLDISGAAGTVGFSLDLDWASWDFTDECNVEYQLDGGAWVTLPPLPGTDGPTTVDFSSDGNSGSGVASATGLSGSTLSIRVCLFSNSSFDDIFIDNVSVPEAVVAVLSVELISFKAKKSKNIVELDWSTATETNNEKFEIEHSSDGSQFEKIGELEGKGTSDLISNYSYNHERPSFGEKLLPIKTS